MESISLSKINRRYVIDLNKNYLSDVERGRRNLSLKAIEKIAKGLNVPIDALFID